MTQLVEARVADLTGEALNWAAAAAQGLTLHLEGPHYGTSWRVFVVRDRGTSTYLERYKPSTEWAQGGALIDQFDVEILRFGEQAFYERDPQWNQKPCVGATIRKYAGCTYSELHIEQCMTAETRLVAVCRAVVAELLGKTVSVPKELYEQA